MNFRRTKLTVIALGLLIMTACTNAPAASPAPSHIANAIISEVEFSSLSEKSVSDLMFYIPLDTADIDGVSYYICGSGAFPDELLVAKFKTAEAASAALPLIKERAEDKINTFTFYAPDEMYKLDGELIKSKKEYILFCVSADNSTAMRIFDGFFK